MSFYFTMYLNQKEVKETEGKKSRAVDHLLNGKKINQFIVRKRNYITDLQNVHFLWTLNMNPHQPNIQGRDLTVPTLNSGTS